MSSQAQLLEGGIISLKSQMGEIFKAHDDAFDMAAEQSRQAGMLEAHIGLLRDELDSLKWMESTSCDMEVVRRKVADDKGDMNGLVSSLCRGTFDLYANIQHGVDQSLSAESKRVREMFNCKAMSLEQDGHDAFCSAARGV